MSTDVAVNDRRASRGRPPPLTEEIRRHSMRVLRGMLDGAQYR